MFLCVEVFWFDFPSPPPAGNVSAAQGGLRVDTWPDDAPETWWRGELFAALGKESFRTALGLHGPVA